ncbi:MAG: Ig domain protein group 1 domain protein, partial [Gemmatimonadetes bacterium]|nr:Ig domain protein group 1 domain protein [Gemmatimonadota bacterium]
MKFLGSRVHRLAANVIVVTAALACGEPLTAPTPIQTRSVVARVNCVASTRTMQVACARADSGSAGTGLSRTADGAVHADLIVGGQNTFVTLTSSNVTYAGDVFSFNTTVQNLIGQKLGTTDGVTLDPNGVRVFFEQLPIATSGSGTIDFVNPVGGGSLVDGYAAFTQSNQPYYQYNQILATNQTSSARNWRIHIPSTVGSFEFSVYVSAAVQYPTGYITVAPASTGLKTGDTQQLSATVYDVVGRPLTGETVTWGTSDGAVATVNSSGLVTAVGDGSATITATSTTRSGTATITVSNAAGGTTTIVGAPPTLTVGSPSTITVQARNASGANLTTGGDAVVLNASAGGSLSAVTDNGNGTYTATLNSTTATTINVTGTINGQTIGHPGAVVFTPGAPANIAKSAGDGQSATAGTDVLVQPAVTITDSNGNPVPGVSVAFAVASGGTGAAVTGSPANTNASGVATLNSWTLGNTAGANSITATAGALTATFTATATAGLPASATKQSTDPQTATVGSAVGASPSVLIKDAHNNPVAGVTVTFAVTGGGGSVTVATPTTNSSGIATLGSWTLGTTAGISNNTLSATAATGSATATFTATATAASASQIVINAGDAQSASAGSPVATPPSVIVRDQYNNPVSGVTVTFSVTGGAGSATVPGPVTSGSGIATVGSWTLGSGGSGCSAAAQSSCTRNTLHASAASGTNPSLDFKAYIPPVVTSAAFQAVGNNTLSVPLGSGLLVNAFSINGDGANGTGASPAVTTPLPTGSLGGTATVAADGSFTYLSAPSTVSTTESFSFAVSDGRSTAAPTATLSVNVPTRVWYVQPGFAGPTKTGADSKPFSDFTAVNTASAASDTILVISGGSNVAGTGTLKASQVVYGQGANVAKTFVLPGSPATYRNGGSTLTLLATGASPLVNGLTLATGNTIRGITLAGTLTGTSFGTLTVSEALINTTVQAVSLATGTLTGGFTSTTSTGGSNNNISMTSVGSSGAFSFGSGALSGAPNDGIYINGGNGTWSYSGSVANASGASSAVNVFSMTG